MMEQQRDRRLELLIRRLPGKAAATIRWLRHPEARLARLPAGILLILGGLLSILPVLGLWMLPLGFFLLSEDVPALRRLSNRLLHRIEHKHPKWMGLPENNG
ncbi:hypothetical protein GOB90_04110 [Acetobacter oeni]|nr:hypothetical protein [Acetobacter oeni]